MSTFSGIKQQAYDSQARRQYAQRTLGLSAFDRHKKFINDYVLFYGKGLPAPAAAAPVKTDHDTLRETYRFLRTEQDDNALETWESRLAKKYYDKLFKEYCLADLSRYKEGAIGMRWRMQKEVISGKGQFICGNKHCDNRMSLASYEVNLAYKEAGENKNALVKLRVCPDCAYKLNYKKEKKLRKAEKHIKAKRRREGVEEGSNSAGGEKHRRKSNRRDSSKSDDGVSDSAGKHRDQTCSTETTEVAEEKGLSAEEAWSGQAQQELEPTKEEEFEQYFMDLFL